MNNKCGTMPGGARVLGQVGTVWCIRHSLPPRVRVNTVGWVPGSHIGTDQHLKHPDVPLIWSD